MNQHIRKLERTILVIISIVFIVWSAAFIYKSSFIAIDGHRYFCLFDDAMISMRYAWNFSHGSGLVWNPGEHIEGYTNLLMTLLMSFSTLVFDKSIAPLLIQILGVGFMLGIAYVCMQIADYFIQDESYQRQAFIRVLSFFCALSYYPLAYWSLMGMETGLLTLLLLLSVLFALNYTKNKNLRSLLIAAGCLGLAFLTRNDSIIFAIPIWFYIVWDAYKSKTSKKSISQLLLAIGFYVLFIIGQEVFRYIYYGDLIPNTYTLKLTGITLSERISNGVGFVKPFLVRIMIILVLSSLDLLFAFERRKFLFLSIVLSIIAYQIYIGGDGWDYWRIMSPFMPLLTILFICAINSILHAISSTQAFSYYFLRNPILPRKYMSEVLIVSLVLIGLISANKQFLPEISLSTKPYTAAKNRVDVNAAIAISQLTTNDASVGVLWAGAIPYFTDRRAIDFLGKSDKYIAHLPADVSGAVSWTGMTSVPGHNKYDLNYSIKSLKPTYVQRFSWGGQDLTQWAETIYVNVDYKGASIFLLKDSPDVLWSKVNTP